MAMETVTQLQHRKIEDTTTHNFVEADATGVPAYKRLDFYGGATHKIDFASAIETSNDRLNLDGLSFVSSGIRRPNLVAGGEHF